MASITNNQFRKLETNNFSLEKFKEKTVYQDVIKKSVLVHVQTAKTYAKGDQVLEKKIDKLYEEFEKDLEKTNWKGQKKDLLNNPKIIKKFKEKLVKAIFDYKKEVARLGCKRFTTIEKGIKNDFVKEYVTTLNKREEFGKKINNSFQTCSVNKIKKSTNLFNLRIPNTGRRLSTMYKTLESCSHKLNITHTPAKVLHNENNTKPWKDPNIQGYSCATRGNHHIRNVWKTEVEVKSEAKNYDQNIIKKITFYRHAILAENKVKEKKSGKDNQELLTENTKIENMATELLCSLLTQEEIINSETNPRNGKTLVTTNHQVSLMESKSPRIHSRIELGTDESKPTNSDTRIVLETDESKPTNSDTGIVLGTEATQNSTIREITISSVSLVYTAEGNKERKMFDRQLEVLEYLKSHTKFSLPSNDPANPTTNIEIKINVHECNFGINGKSISRRRIGISSGWKGRIHDINSDYVNSFFSKLTCSQVDKDDFYVISNKNQNLGDRIKKSALYKDTSNSSEIKQKKELAALLLKQIKAIWDDGSYKRSDDDRCKMAARLYLLSALLGEKSLINCYSGKDRTAEAQVEATFLWEHFNQTGSIPEPGAPLNRGETECLQTILAESGQLEIQELNTGGPGYKTNSAGTGYFLGLSKRFSGRSLDNWSLFGGKRTLDIFCGASSNFSS